jgi:hypothetical protein
MKRLLMVIGLIFVISCSSFGFKSKNYVELKLKKGGKITCSLENKDKQGNIHCSFVKDKLVYDCFVNVNKTDIINVEEDCNIISDL